MIGRKWLTISAGAMVGAGLWPLCAFLIDLTDKKGGWDPPTPFLTILFFVYQVTSLPGVVVEVRGPTTLVVISGFWGLVGAWIASAWIRRLDARKRASSSRG